MKSKREKKMVLVCLSVLILIGVGIIYFEYKTSSTKKSKYFKENEVEIISNKTEENENEVELEIKIPETGQVYEYSFDGGQTWTLSNKAIFSENKEVVVMVKDYLGTIVAKKTYSVQVADVTGPVININVPKEIYQGTTINLMDYIEVLDKSGIQEVIVNKDSFNTDTVGNKEVTVTATDNVGNKTEISFIVNVVELPEEINEGQNNNNNNNNGNAGSNSNNNGGGNSVTPTPKKTTYYRYRVKTTSSYACNYYDCSYIDNNQLTNTTVEFGSESYCCNTENCSKINPTVNTPCPAGMSCPAVMTNQYKAYGNVCYNVGYINLEPEPEQKCKKLKNGEIYCTWTVIPIPINYLKTECESGEILIGEYCHKIDSYGSYKCPDGYSSYGDKCAKVVKKTCSNTCTNTSWSEWSEWTTAYIAANDYTQVETKVE